jgi:hypothetical protein
LQNFQKLSEELSSNFTKDAKMQESNIEGLQSHLKSKAKVQKLKVKGEKDIGIEVLDKIYNEKYKQCFYYIPLLGFRVCRPMFST